MQLKDRLRVKRFESIEQEAVLSVLVVSNMLRSELELICMDYNINSSIYNVLRILNGSFPNGLSRTDIHRRMLDRNPDLTRILDRMEKASLIRRLQNDSDKRKSISFITFEGKELIEKMKKDIQKFDRYLLQFLTRKECQDLSDLCCKICDEDLL
jgi:DNA-binding MarR family transcriptional regulator